MEVERFKKEVAKGELLFKDKKKRNEALEHFNMMALACPQNLFFKIRQIKINIDLQQWKNAESICIAMLNSGETNFFTYYFYSLILMKKKNHSNALKFINIGLEKYPEKAAISPQKIILEELSEEITLLKLLRR